MPRLQKDGHIVTVEATLLENPPLADGVTVCSGIIQIPSYWKPEPGEYVLTMDDGRSAEIFIFEIRPEEKVAYFVGRMHQ